MNCKKKYERSISLFLTILMVISLMVSTSAQPKLSDIAGHWAEGTIRFMESEDIIGGYSDGTFKPDNNITRAEFATIVVKTYDLQGEEGKIFKDTKGHWAESIIATANYHGIVGGYDENSFGPDDFITREQMAAMIVNATEISDIDSSIVFRDDNEISSWAKEHVDKVATVGLMGGYSDNTFRPQRNATRAEAATVLNNAMNLLNEEEKSTVFNKAGVYGDEDKTTEIFNDVFIKANGVTLDNYVIHGNLTITEEVGDGEVTLNDVDVNEIIYVNGGGANSIYINGGSHKELVVNNTPTKIVRVVVSNLGRINLEISEEAVDQEVILEGPFNNVSVKGNNNTVTTQGKTTVEEINVSKESSNATLQVNKDTIIEKLILDSKSTVNNEKDTIKDISGSEMASSSISNTVERERSGGGSSGGSVTTPSYSLNIIASKGNVTGGGSYTAGSDITLTAEHHAGYELAYWVEDDEVISSDLTFEYTMPSSNTTVTAYFVKEGYIPIRTSEDLDEIRNNLTGNYHQIANIDLKNQEWTPIGPGIDMGRGLPAKDSTFTGTFNGNGFNIENLSIKKEPNFDGIETTEDIDNLFFVGLFEVAMGADFKNINLINVESEGLIVGSLAGSLIQSNIKNVHVTGNVHGGGATGGLSGLTEDSTIENVSFKGNVSDNVSWEVPENIVKGVGGLIGYAGESTILKSLTSGEVEGDIYIGGLIGYSYISVINSSESNSDISGNKYTGGLIGRMYEGEINGSHSEGNISGEEFVGGLVGSIYSYNDNKAFIKDSHASGDVEGLDNVGGLVGISQGVIDSSHATGDVIGGQQVGGLVGRNTREVTNSYALGVVRGYNEVGGLVGNNSSANSSVIGSSAKNISIVRLEGDETSFGRVVGFNEGTLENNYGNTSMLTPYEGAFDTVGDDDINGQNRDFSQMYKVEFSISGGTGDIDATVDGNIINSGDSLYKYTTVEIEVRPEIGYRVKNWKINGEDIGDVGKTNKTLQIDSDYDTEVILEVAPNNDITFTEQPKNGFIEGEGSYEEGEVVNLKATPDAGYELAYWVIDNEVVSHQPNFEYTMPSSNKEVSAYFVKEGHLPVRTVEELDNIRNNLDKKHYQVADIDLQGLDWVPIGVYDELKDAPPEKENAFNGTFDGSNHTIYNLTAVEDEGLTPEEKYAGEGIPLAGLFDAAVEATFKNINIIDASTGGFISGALVGYLADSTIENVHVTGNIQGHVITGGIIGIMERGEIRGSSFIGNVECTPGDIGQSGGILGLGEEDVTIIDSFSEGTVTGRRNVGGLAASMRDGHIENSYSKSTISGTEDTGGLVGLADGTAVIDSYAEGDVYGVSSVGGLIGRVSANDGRMTVDSSYATGNVTGIHRIGGLIGNNNGEINNSHGYGDVEGDRYIGGLVGDNQWKIKDSSASGTVSGNYFVGGIQGIGSNIGSLENSSAKNPSIIRLEGEETSFGRIAGRNELNLANNYARVNMVEPFEGAFDITGLNTINGESVDFNAEYKVEFRTTGGNATIEATAEGSSLSSGDTVQSLKTVVFNVTPENGNEVVSWKINDVDIGNEGQTTKEIVVASDIDIEVIIQEPDPSYSVNFSSQYGEVTIEAIVNGTNIGDGDRVTVGDTVEFAVNYPIKYEVEDWEVNGVSTGVDSNEYQLEITEDVTIEVILKELPTHQISFSVQPNDGATITAELEDSTKLSSGDGVPEGAIVTFKVELNDNYIIYGWMVGTDTVGIGQKEIQLSIESSTMVNALLEEAPEETQPIAHTEVELIVGNTFNESYTAGNLITDAVNNTVTDEVYGNIAFLPGNIMDTVSSISPGPVYEKDLIEIYTMFIGINNVVTGELKGQDIKDFLLTESQKSNNAPVQVSGIKYDVFIGDEGTVTDVELFMMDGEDLDLDETYKVAFCSNEYEEYNLDGKISNKATTSDTIKDILIDYVENLLNPIPASLGDTRIKVI
ncbi:S-layer domain protein [Alkaliphilus metalliredigens QYMF]|uniref:S-layer domain protein n=1 Tax=Alkaliphilus metalliredigens (strain QYMF) TaxID=293826 RepID=A6TLW3_ALKMQ|nr:S-layer homology domain-containing protein [Alkaliphilus metalliredigens]ABR47181.1 S-layer domain protein [Alkaliphilus metalliredigens QYMF]